jgi:hypothetical protein
MGRFHQGTKRDELVAAFADLFAEGFDVEGDVDDGEGFSPCGGVEPVAFDEGSVDVGEDGFYHGTHLWDADGGLDAVRASARKPASQNRDMPS